MRGLQKDKREKKNTCNGNEVIKVNVSSINQKKKCYKKAHDYGNEDKDNNYGNWEYHDDDEDDIDNSLPSNDLSNKIL